MEKQVSFSLKNPYKTQTKPEDYIPWVRRIVAKWKARLPANVEWDDLVQAGMMGLMECWGTYDASKGASFETFASSRVQGSILDWLRSQDPMPKDARTKWKSAEKFIRSYLDENSVYPNESEIAKGIGLSLEAYQKLSDSAYAYSVFEPEMNADGEYAMPEGVETNTPELLFESTEVREKLVSAIKTLPEKEAIVVQLYYVEDMNLKEIGAVLDLTEARASQLLKKALVSLRAYMN